MNHRTTTWQRSGPFLTGVLLGALAWTPAFAATLNLPEEWQPYLLTGSVVLLAIALMLKAMGAGRGRSESSDNPVDMRTAHQIDAVDVPLHQ